MNANDLRFRKIRLDDIRFVADLERRFFSTPWDEDALQKVFDSGYETFYVAICGDERVGYLGYSKSFECADILTICIHPEYRRRGHAERLLNFCFEQMRQEGAEKAFLEVRQSNAPARALYEGAGFVYLNKRINYYKNPTEDAWVMIKELI